MGREKGVMRKIRRIEQIEGDEQKLGCYKKRRGEGEEEEEMSRVEDIGVVERARVEIVRRHRHRRSGQNGGRGGRRGRRYVSIEE